MKNAKGKQARENSSRQTGQWASKVISIVKNTKQGGIEVTFDSPGPSPWLQVKMRAKGFRNSKRKVMWYADDTEEHNAFAEEIRTAIQSNEDGPELILWPSVKPLKANLEKKDYCFVMFTLKNGQTKNYLVFEPSKPKAEIIASNFGAHEFGEQLNVFAVLPKTRIKEARALFASSQIIYPDEQSRFTPTVSEHAEVLVNNRLGAEQPAGSKAPIKTIFLSTIAYSRKSDYSMGVELHTWKDANEYVKSKIGTYSDVYYNVEWMSGDHFNGWIDIEPPDFYNNIADPLSRHIKSYLTNYAKIDDKHFLYSKENIEHAQHLLDNCLFEDLSENENTIDQAKEQPIDERTEPAVEDEFAETPADRKRSEELEALNSFYKWAALNGKLREITLDVMTEWLHENKPELSAQNISNIWNSHLRIEQSQKIKIKAQKPNHPFDTIYKKILKIIPGLIEHIKEGKIAGKSDKDPEGGLMPLNFDFLYYDKNGDPVIALSHYFKQNGDMIADPDMQIRLMPGKEMAEAMTYQDQFGYKYVYVEKEGRTFVNARQRKDLNTFLNQWLTNLIHQGHTIDLASGDEEGHNYYRDAWELLAKLVPALNDLTNRALMGRALLPANGKPLRREITCMLGRTSGGRYSLGLMEEVGLMERLRYSVDLITETHTVVVNFEWFAEGVAVEYGRSESQKQILKRNGDVGEEQVKGLILWLEEVLSAGVTIDIPKVSDSVNIKDASLKVKETLAPEPEKQASVILAGTPVFDPAVMVQLINAQNYLVNAWSLSYPKTVLSKNRFDAGDFANLHAFFSIYVQEDSAMQVQYLDLYRKLFTATVNLTFQDTDAPLPNVLVPIGTKEPFLSHGFKAYDMRSMLEIQFPKLSALSNETLGLASPVQLYELAQLGNPKMYHIAISQDKLIDIWRTRGKELFDTLGFPTNPYYPYADLIAGYENMMPLRDLLNDNNTSGDEWWIAAALYRPIADLEKAQDILNDLIQKKELEKKTYLTADGERPRPNYKSRVEQMDRTIGYLKESQAVLHAYFDRKGNADLNKIPLLQHDIPTDDRGDSAKLDEKKIGNPDSTTLSKSSKKSNAVDLAYNQIPVPNVLVPAETSEPFYSQAWVEDMPALLRTKFPHLYVLNDQNLLASSAVALFELMQLDQTDAYGLSVSREGLLKAWEIIGEAIFTELDFPTDENHPYVSLHHGYEVVHTLGSILSDMGRPRNAWWMAAHAYRPMADISKGYVIMNEFIRGLEDERASYINPDTKQIRPQHKNQAGNIEFRILKTLQRYKLLNDLRTERPANAGDNREDIQIPIPSTARYEAKIILEKSPDGYKMGYSISKNFRMEAYLGMLPAEGKIVYNSRNEVLKGALEMHLQQLHRFFEALDTWGGSKKEISRDMKRLTMAENAIMQYATEHDIQLSLPSLPSNEDEEASLEEESLDGKSSTYGSKIEQINIPIPPETWYIAKIMLEETSEGFKIGYSIIKDFHPDSDFGALPRDSKLNYVNRKEAIKAALYWHLARLREFFEDLDKWKPSERRLAENTKRLKTVEKAILQFAADQNIDLPLQANLTETPEIIYHKPVSSDDFRLSTDETDAGNKADPLVDENGIYNEKSAGDKFEEITIPIPPEVQYQAEVSIVRSSTGYRIGLSASKNFGTETYSGIMPRQTDKAYASRQDALEAALQIHIDWLEESLSKPDADDDASGQNTQRLRLALEAIETFALHNDITLDINWNKSDRDFTNHPNDALADDSGVYTSQSAGKNFETLQIPMPKSSGYEAVVYLVLTSDGTYKDGIMRCKSFGAYSYVSNLPTVGAASYRTRKSALKAALLHHEQELEVLMGQDDSFLKTQDIKTKKLQQAMKALYQFASEQGISMKAIPDPNDLKIELVQGLEDAYWRESDNENLKNLVTIMGVKFHQSRLRNAISKKLNELPLSLLKEIVNELTYRFSAAVSLEEHLERLLKNTEHVDETNERRWMVVYVDDLIFNNDVYPDNQRHPVMTFLIEQLYSGAARLADLPQNTAGRQEQEKPIKKKQNQLNQEIETFIDRKDNEGENYSDEEKNYLQQYTGSGGLLSEGAQGRGTLYEYYTPDSIVKRMWDIAYHYGYDGGSILEPAVGTGHFLKYAPKDAPITGYETNHYACRIAQILYPNAHIQEKAFESHFFAGNIHLKEKFENPAYSLVIGNPPYGAFTGKYAGLGEKKHTGVTEYDQYFMLRSLDLMKPGGLLVFLVSSYFMLSMQKYNSVKEKIIVKAEWVDGYRLPASAVPNTDVGTDIIVLRRKTPK